MASFSESYGLCRRTSASVPVSVPVSVSVSVSVSMSVPVACCLTVSVSVPVSVPVSVHLVNAYDVMYTYIKLFYFTTRYAQRAPVSRFRKAPICGRVRPKRLAGLVEGMSPRTVSLVTLHVSSVREELSAKATLQPRIATRAYHVHRNPSGPALYYFNLQQLQQRVQRWNHNASFQNWWRTLQRTGFFSYRMGHTNTTACTSPYNSTNEAAERFLWLLLT